MEFIEKTLDYMEREEYILNMKYKKAIIITIYDPNPNMGNRLQNYAVQNVMEKLGFEVSSIAFRKPKMNMKNKIKLFINQMTNYYFATDKLYWKLVPNQIKSFDEFNKNYIKTNRIKCLQDIPKADYYILGSDQLWNPQWWNKANPDMEKNLYLGTFANPEQLVCFSPSFGRAFIPDKWKGWFEQNLKRMTLISVREEAGKKIIKELTGKDAVVTIDPTLMLKKEEWSRISEKPKNIKQEGKYILTYFLGGRSDRVNKDIEKYASNIKANVYYLFDKQHPDFFFSNPSNFLYLIEHAELILTDSFHACVFSFIYDKPFLVYNRIEATEMMSRMETLFKKFDLERKYADSGIENDVYECDYSVGKTKLIEEQKKVISFLKKSMKIE